ncbi:hypothetical protein HPB50_025481 [Hyalomma asiaticum]|uniref:Uncharacterized protein n=1 Tax=Hyalomma asiaticum TaxID=266040 RepID=A0ACB7SI63_HYAAI|nr:hypothetical protein HPB50_025481 [Hyalomma asiaticum]
MSYWNRGAYAVSAVDARLSLINAVTVATNFIYEAEDMVIAVALRSCTKASVIYWDSRIAIRTFSVALVSSKAAAGQRFSTQALLQERREENFPSSHTTWFPAHMGNISGTPDCNPNERAHQVVRELTFRVCGPPPRFNTAWRNLDNKDPLKRTVHCSAQGFLEFPGRRRRTLSTGPDLGGATRLVGGAAGTAFFLLRPQ